MYFGINLCGLHPIPSFSYLNIWETEIVSVLVSLPKIHQLTTSVFSLPPNYNILEKNMVDWQEPSTGKFCSCKTSDILLPFLFVFLFCAKAIGELFNETDLPRKQI